MQVNRAVADKIQLEEYIKHAQEDILTRIAQATEAVRAGKDELARTALNLKKQAEASLKDYQNQLKEQTQALQDLQENLRILTDKLSKAKAERDNLIMCQRRAATMKKANEVISGITGNDPLSNIDRFKDKVERTEAEAKATSVMVTQPSEDPFVELEHAKAEQDIEMELAELKKERDRGSLSDI
ncbi:PspA/IM30 family protein [Desulfosporosinus sp. OT]|uniref:PspA/IM30 family protein n=1 Tax=Desulfosporosinus sp. OT TaxID=913865 RepID=UPI000A061795|nr:PspA/IM30 family protein [Desulfosporosinus sp. OT]